jgi:cytochrome c biogenesis protein CcmG/thiol:disulfide interchange protein DsbE
MTQEGGRSRRYLVARAAAIVLPLVVVVAIVGVIMASRGAGRSTRPDLSTVTFVASPVPEHRTAPAFTLPLLDGTGSTSLARYSGKIVVLNLWASWCGPCRDESPKLQSLWESYRSLGVQFLGVDQQDSKGAASAFVSEFGLMYPVAFDPDGSVAASFGALGLPTTFVIDASGVIRYRFLGRVDPAGLQDVLQGLMAGRR